MQREINIEELFEKWGKEIASDIEEFKEHLESEISDESEDDAYFDTKYLIDALKTFINPDEWNFYIVKTGWTSANYAILAVRNKDCKQILIDLEGKTRKDAIEEFLSRI